MLIEASNILLLAGGQNSGPGHWQSLWQARHGYRHVEQHDWQRPLRGDWTARLEETVVDADGPVLLVAHSLVSRHRSSVCLRWSSNRIAVLHRLPIRSVLAARCALRYAPMAAHSLRHLTDDATPGGILTAWWAAHSAYTHRVQGALPVAPGDVERPDLAAQIHHWAPIARQALPFPALLVASRDDPYCSLARAENLARVWGAHFIDLVSGFINLGNYSGQPDFMKPI